MFYFIFDYNYGNIRQILIIFIPLETEMNTLPKMYKLFHFNLIMSPYYLVKLKIHVTQKQPTAYCSAFCWTDCSKLCRKSFNVRLFHCLLEHFFSSLLTGSYLHSRRFFIKNLSSNSIWLILTCKQKLKVLTCDVMCHNYDVIKLLSK